MKEAPPQDQGKEREQGRREAEEEMESLSCRNQELTRGVEVLEGEVSVGEARGGGRKTKVGAGVRAGAHVNALEEDGRKEWLAGCLQLALHLVIYFSRRSYPE